MSYARRIAPLGVLFTLTAWAGAVDAASPAGVPQLLSGLEGAEVQDAVVDAAGRVSIVLNGCSGYADCTVEVQRFDATGLPDSPRIIHNPRSPPFILRGDVEIAADASGDFAVIESYNRDVTCYRADGTRVGTARIPAPGRTGTSIEDVAMDADGDFVVGWRELTALSTYLGGFEQSVLKIRRFNVTTCAATGPERVVTRSSTGYAGSIPRELHSDLKLAMSPNGRLAATWLFHGLSGSVVRTQTWGPGGLAVGGVQTVTSRSAWMPPSIGIADDGAFVIAYAPTVKHNGSSSAGDVVFRRFSASGTPSAPQSAGLASPYLGPFDASVGVDAAGDFVVGWTSVNLVPNDVRDDATIRRFDAGTGTLDAPSYVAPGGGSANHLFAVLQQPGGSYAALYQTAGAGPDTWYLQRYLP